MGRFEIEEALRAAGDAGAAAAWRYAVRELGGGIRVGVLARDAGRAVRVAREMSADLPGVEVVALPTEPPDDDVPVGADDRVLGLHLAVWATPLTAPLGAEDRAVLAALAASGAPSACAVMVADTHLLDRMSDDPAAELADVHARIEGLLPPGWQLLERGAVLQWIGRAAEDLGAHIARRRVEVATALLRDAAAAADRDRRAQTRALAELDALLAAEDGALLAERRRAERVAGHVLASVRRRTEELLIDHRAFLRVLEEELPKQLDGLDDVHQARRVLPHWLRHVAEGWMRDRLAAWRAAVLEDAVEVGVDGDEAARVDLLVPSLQPSVAREDGAWGARLGATATLGGGVAMLFVGLWIPAALAVSGGLLWGALAERSRQARGRETLLDAARDAVRRLGRDADELLRDQLTALEAGLDAAVAERSARAEEAGAATRADLEQQRARCRARIDQLQGVSDGLVELSRAVDGP